MIERVLLLEAEDEILAHHLPSEFTAVPREARGASGPAARQAFPAGIVRPLAEIEQMAIAHALEVCDGNKTRAAQMLGISRQTLRTKLKELRMEDDNETGGDPPA
jgi:DNA-binding NtrC family response regulator